VTEHLNSCPATMYVPSNEYPNTVSHLFREDCNHATEAVIPSHGKSNLGPTRKQHDLFVLMRMSNQSSSSSHIWKNRWSSTTDWV